MSHPRSFFDQMGTAIVVPSYPPARIVSLVPSQTELLFDLGLDQEVVGITKFCVHPAHWLTEKKIIGGTKNFHLEVIDALKPDLVIGNKEENYPEGIGQLRRKYPVWMSDITTFSQALEMIRSVGRLTGREERSEEVVQRIESSFQRLVKRPSRRVLYLIWRKPWMAAGADTFIDDMLSRIGFINCLEHRPRYPELSDDDIRQLNPDIILLSSEPYPFQEKHRRELAEITSSATLLVDGEMFSWYGSRLIQAPGYVNNLRF